MPEPISYGRPSKRSRALGVLGALGVFAVLAWLLWSLMQDHRPAPKRTPPRITQVILPPPPPPPPPPQPEKVQDEPKPVENTPFESIEPPKEDSPEPPGDPLTADAGPGNNEFGLQAGTGGGGTRIGGKGGGGNPYAGYAAMVQRTVQQYLQQSEKTRKGRYSATVAMWLNADGTIQRSQVIAGTGKAELDAAIVAALQGRALPQAPPTDMPQPINLRIGAMSPG
jgi:protein TonB